jgi:hypothetical protein
MNEPNDGGPAFPTPRYERGDMYSMGMTLRDYFAAKFMHSILQKKHVIDVEYDPMLAYRYADALLAARSQPWSQP